MTAPAPVSAMIAYAVAKGEMARMRRPATIIERAAAIAVSRFWVAEARRRGAHVVADSELMMLALLEARQRRALAEEGRLLDPVPDQPGGGVKALAGSQVRDPGYGVGALPELRNITQQLLTPFFGQLRNQGDQQSLRGEFAGARAGSCVGEGQHSVHSCGLQPGCEPETAAGATLSPSKGGAA